MQWASHNQQHSASYPLHYPTQAYQNSQTESPANYQSYHYTTTNHPQPLPTLQTTYHHALPQITYPMLSNTNANQLKAEPNPPPPPPPQQAQEPPQQTENFPTHGTILTITRGSNTDLETKRQHRDYYRQVNHVVVEGPITQTKWSHMSITFSSQDVNLTSYPHTDGMAVIVHIDIWDVTKILIDNGSQVKILFLTTFNKMGFDRKQLNETSKPLYGFGGKIIEPVRAITLLVSFNTLKNPRTEYITFNVADMTYPYNAIFRRGLLNIFETALHSAYQQLLES
jgi:hypothetical protein